MNYVNLLTPIKEPPINLSRFYGGFFFDNSLVRHEGWALYDDGLIHVRGRGYDHDLQSIRTDEQAIEHVREHAARPEERYAYHRRAWEIHCTTIATQRLRT
jgi:hypothetical protein